MLTSRFLALTPDPDKQLAHIYISRHVVIFGGVSENVNYNMVVKKTVKRAYIAVCLKASGKILAKFPRSSAPPFFLPFWRTSLAR